MTLQARSIVREFASEFEAGECWVRWSMFAHGWPSGRRPIGSRGGSARECREGRGTYASGLVGTLQGYNRFCRIDMLSREEYIGADRSGALHTARTGRQFQRLQTG